MNTTSFDIKSLPGDFVLVSFLINAIMCIYGIISINFPVDPEPVYVYECDCEDTDSESEMFAIRVFRFMDGSSCYILDDDDEYVVVFPDQVVRMREYVGSLLCRATDKSQQEMIVLYKDLDDEESYVTVTHFHDKFELQKFEEFLDESFEKTDSESVDDESVY